MSGDTEDRLAGVEAALAALIGAAKKIDEPHVLLAACNDLAAGREKTGKRHYDFAIDLFREAGIYPTN